MILASLLLCSNRPGNMATYLDRLEAVTIDPSRVEVVVKIDEGDAAMAGLMAREAGRRPFRLVAHASLVSRSALGVASFHART